MIRTFTIPFKLPGLNEYIKACRANKYAGAKLKQDTENGIMYILNTCHWQIKRPINVTFIWHEKNRRRDKDNVAFAKKFVLDALQKSGKLPNDNNAYILGFTDSFVYGDIDGVAVALVEVE